MTPEPAPPAVSLLEEVVAAIATYQDGHLLYLKVSREPGWVLWHAHAAQASAQITDAIRAAAQPPAASPADMMVAAVVTYRDSHLRNIPDDRNPNQVIWHGDAATVGTEIITLIRQAAAARVAGPRRLASTAA